MRYLSELGTVLGVWAHPDDEAYLSGGLMALTRDAGNRVVCVTATHGERGTPDPARWPPGRLAAERATELRDCLAILGVTEHHWLGYRDGECDRVPSDQAVARIGALIDAVRPDTVLTFGPDGNTGHPDHRAVARWTATAVDQAMSRRTAAAGRAAPAPIRLLQSAVADRWAARWQPVHDRFHVFEPGYPVTRPEADLTLHLTLDPDTVDRKVRALAAQRTQTTALIEAMGAAEYAAWVTDETFTEGGRWWDPGRAGWVHTRPARTAPRTSPAAAPARSAAPAPD